MPMKEFNDFEEALEWIQQNEAIANRKVHPIQAKILRGCYALRPYTNDLVIYGYVLTEEEIRWDELKYGADEGELEFTIQHLNASFERGYRYGKWHSVACHDGEYGDAHVSTLMPLTKEDFELAKLSDWNVAADKVLEFISRGVEEALRG